MGTVRPVYNNDIGQAYNLSGEEQKLIVYSIMKAQSQKLSISLC
jgi:hypothetical protein